LPDTPPGTAVRTSRIVDHDLLLVLENTIDAIEGARLRVLGHLAPLALAPRVINRLEVVLEELISNVVRHGFDERPDHAMLLAVGAGPAGLKVTLEDDGRPFNPFALAPPPAFDTLANAQIGGLGVPVVRRFATATSYEAEPESPSWEALVRKDSRPVNRVKVTLAA
jgi:anti-sigma regulatory factor (Ser/Thr protein kinase)